MNSPYLTPRCCSALALSSAYSAERHGSELGHSTDFNIAHSHSCAFCHSELLHMTVTFWFVWSLVEGLDSRLRVSIRLAKFSCSVCQLLIKYLLREEKQSLWFFTLEKGRMWTSHNYDKMVSLLCQFMAKAAHVHMLWVRDFGQLNFIGFNAVFN